MASQGRYTDKPWLAHYEKGVPECIDYELISLTAYLDNSAKRFPDRTALICGGFKVSYRRLYEMTGCFAACLTAFGQAIQIAPLLLFMKPSMRRVAVVSLGVRWSDCCPSPVCGVSDVPHPAAPTRRRAATPKHN